MQASPKAARNHEYAAKAVERYGDLIWETVTDAFVCNRPFTLYEAVRAVHRKIPLRHATLSNYVRATLQSVMDQELPADVPPQIARASRTTYVLPRN